MKKIFILLIVLVFAACQPSPIQEFFAEKQEDPKFNSLVLPASLLGIAQDSLNEEQRAAVNSLEKVHFVWQQVDSLTTDISKGIEQAESALNDPNYETLMKVQMPWGQGRVLFKGTEDAVDEFVVMGKRDSLLVMARIMGDNMHPKYLMPFLSSMNQAQPDMEALKPLMMMLQEKEVLPASNQVTDTLTKKS
jgi:hypothetical protein